LDLKEAGALWTLLPVGQATEAEDSVCKTEGKYANVVVVSIKIYRL
jgi:hypothetical protein